MYTKEEFIVDDKTTNTFYLFSRKYLHISLQRRPTRLSTLEPKTKRKTKPLIPINPYPHD